jgi:outer membrane protein OmpA-like peptidoglycan-associated protein
MWLFGLSDPFHWTLSLVIGVVMLALRFWWRRRGTEAVMDETAPTVSSEYEDSSRNYLRDVVVAGMAAGISLGALASASALLAHTPVYAAFYDTGCSDIRQKAETLLAGGGYDYGIRMINERLRSKASAGCRSQLNELLARLWLGLAAQTPAAERRQRLEQAQLAADRSGLSDLRDRMVTELRALEVELASEREKVSTAQYGDRVVVTLGDLLFESGRAVLKSDAETTLQHVGEKLQGEHQGKPVRVEGHTDDAGPEAFNLWLSRQRAEAVRKALIRSGINGDLITIEGYGSTRPIRNDTSPEARSQNRRVEIIVPRS